MCVCVAVLVFAKATTNATMPPITLAQRAPVDAVDIAYGAIIIHSPHSAASQLAQCAVLAKNRMAASTAMIIPNINWFHCTPLEL